MTTALNIALSKGRILEEGLPLLERAGIRPTENPLKSRKLILDTNLPDVKLTIIRAADVPTYVQFGAADLGIAGKDVLMEYDGDGLYELMDLKIARCRMMVAEPASLASRSASLRAASSSGVYTLPSAFRRSRASRRYSRGTKGPWRRKR